MFTAGWYLENEKIYWSRFWEGKHILESSNIDFAFFGVPGFAQDTAMIFTSTQTRQQSASITLFSILYSCFHGRTSIRKKLALLHAAVASVKNSQDPTVTFLDCTMLEKNEYVSLTLTSNSGSPKHDVQTQLRTLSAHQLSLNFEGIDMTN